MTPMTHTTPALPDVLIVDGPEAVRHARDHVQLVCRASHLTHLCDLAALLASELVTNALCHARGRAQVVANPVGDRLRVAIADDSKAPPQLKPADHLSEGGRGMLLVDALARSWGVDVAIDGKVVWFEI
jgi:anti-sigma regulatory factor (Ser/Thr protein kinase)